MDSIKPYIGTLVALVVVLSLGFASLAGVPGLEEARDLLVGVAIGGGVASDATRKAKEA